MLPQRGRLAVIARLQPAAAGQRDDVKDDGALSSSSGRIHPQRSQARPQRSISTAAAEESSARGSDTGGEWPWSAGSATKGKRPRGGGSWRTQPGAGSGGAAPAPPRFRLRARRPAWPASPGRAPGRRGRARVKAGWVSLTCPRAA